MMPEQSKYEKNKEYAKAYLKNFEDIKVRLPIGKRDLIKKHAESMGESLNGFVIRAIKEAMERDRR